MYNLLFCINSRYTEMLKVCLSSVVIHSGFDSMSVSIIYSSLRDSEIAEIKKLENSRLKINFIRFDDSVLSSSPPLLLQEGIRRKYITVYSLLYCLTMILIEFFIWMLI